MRCLLVNTILSFIILTGCSSQESFDITIPQSTDLILGLNVESSYLKNQIIYLNMIDLEGNNINSITEFVVDDQVINSNTTSFENFGTHQVYAKYEIDAEIFTTELKVFDILEPITKVVVEDYTGTWCGYCPPVAHAIDELRELTDNITVVGIHNNDQLTIDLESDLRSELSIGGFPSARLNRTISWVDPYEVSEVQNLISLQNNLAISINSTVDNNTLNVDLRYVSKVELNNHKLVLYLVENNLIYDQTNYFNFVEDSYFYNLGNPIENYSHHDVLRVSITNISGDNLADISPLTDYKTNFSIEISPGFITENLGVVAIIVDSNNNAINSQFTAVNSFQDFN